MHNNMLDHEADGLLSTPHPALELIDSELCIIMCWCNGADGPFCTLHLETIGCGLCIMACCSDDGADGPFSTSHFALEP